VLQPKFSVGGGLEGLVGMLTLKLNGSEQISLTADNAFAFPWGLFDEASYEVTIESHPETQTCLMANEAGTISGANVTDVQVTCACNDGLADCDGVASNGCEADTMIDPGNCGGCNLPCASGDVCVDGACEAP
jgi:hypothetical protein